MHRVLISSGKIIVTEPDWETLVINSDDILLTRKILNHQCNYIANPWMGRQLHEYFLDVGFKIEVCTTNSIQLLNYDIADFFYQFTLNSQRAVDHNIISIKQQQRWLNDLQLKAAEGKFFSSIILFTFLGIKGAPIEQAI